jgi:aminopeptidase-like protein
MKELYSLLERLYPICRSITGNGVRETLNILKEYIPINIYEVQSGEIVYDWKVPKEWNITDAYVMNNNGEKIIDFKKHNLHVLNYSIPFSGKLTYEELLPHLHYLKEYPDAIPYLTTYYKEAWGFCLSYNQFKDLDKNDMYYVKIDSTLESGYLTYADLLIKGKTDKEILLSTYICHPSMCNDIMSAVCVQTYLAKYLLSRDNYYSYRIVFVPETIGSITYINKNYSILRKNVIGGYALSCVGDEGEFTYMKTRKENQIIDKITLHILKHSTEKFKLRQFNTCGSDERQYNYPGVDLHIGSLMKTKYGEFWQYHTSADDLTFVTENGLTDSYNMYIKCIECLENNFMYTNVGLCEPQLGKRGLYNLIGGQKSQGDVIRNRMTILRYSDGEHDLIDIAEILNIPVWELYDEMKLLNDKNLITKLK